MKQKSFAVMHEKCPLTEAGVSISNIDRSWMYYATL